MAIVPPDTVLSHWYSLLENFQTSPLEFYTAVEGAVTRREVPQIEISRVDWSEAGVFTAKREYLRVSRGPYLFDICGAPFGTGFFVSSWLVRPQSAPWPLALLGLLIGAYIVLALFGAIFGYIVGSFLFLIGFPVLFWGFVQAMNGWKEGWDDAIVAIPLFGAIYERLFRPETYYKIDTTLMFQESIHNAVLEAVDQVTSGKGVRALSELERKPTLLRFAKSAGA